MPQAGPPPAPRLLAALGALVLGGLLGVVVPAGFLQSGHPFAAAALVLTVAPLVAFLALLAAAPHVLQRLLARWTALDLADAGHVAVAVVMAGTLFFVVGYGSIVDGIYALETVLVEGDREALSEVDGDALFVGLSINLVILVVPPLAYVAVVHRLRLADALRALGVREEGAARALGLGVAVALAVLLGVALLSALLQLLPGEVEPNERALAIARSVTVLGALGIAVVSSISEEVFFRGFLQPRIGLWGQTVVFALAHLNYVHLLEIVVVTVLGVVFGLLYRRTGNLLAPIATHFTFNLLMLLAGIYAPAPEPA